MNQVAQSFSRELRKVGTAEELYQAVNDTLSVDGEDVVSKRCIQYSLSGEKLMSIEKVHKVAKATKNSELLSKWLVMALGVKSANIELLSKRKTACTGMQTVR